MSNDPVRPRVGDVLRSLLPEAAGLGPLSIRAAMPADAGLLKTLIHEFAAFERLRATITEEQVLRDGFGSRAFFQALIAEWEKRPAGYALFYDHYASFQGGPAMFLEDIYVRQEFRRKGIGKALFAQLAAIAQAKNSVTILFHVLDWNTAAINVYRSLGATFLDDWKTLCLEAAAVDRLARFAGRGAQP